MPTGVYKKSKETKKKMSESRKKYFENNPEAKIKISRINKGKPLSKEVKEKLRKKAKERYKNKENHPMYGKKHSKETINKMRKIKVGKTHTQETKKKMSLTRKGKMISYEQRMLLSKNRLGNKNPAWKGGVKEVSRTIRKMFESRLWIKYCMERDNYTCQKCKIIGGRLEVHHIKPLSKILKENNIKSVEDARKCLELWDLNKGLTLCEDCHASVDEYRNRTKMRKIN